jgi:hypothetical protein
MGSVGAYLSDRGTPEAGGAAAEAARSAPLPVLAIGGSVGPAGPLAFAPGEPLAAVPAAAGAVPQLPSAPLPACAALQQVGRHRGAGAAGAGAAAAGAYDSPLYQSDDFRIK